MGSEKRQADEVWTDQGERDGRGGEPGRGGRGGGRVPGDLGLDSGNNNRLVFKVFSSNVDSLLNKRQELAHIFNKENPDIILLNEVLPKKCVFDVQPSEITFSGYDCFSNCFGNKMYKPRGVVIYVKENLNAQPVILNQNQLKAKETTWVEIKLKNEEKLLIGCIYRPPSNSKHDNLILYETILDIIGNKTHVLLAGDFNQPDIDWASETSKIQSKNGEDLNDSNMFMTFFYDSFLYQHVQSPTHYRGDQTPTLIDLILSSEQGMIQNLCQSAPVGKSHHQVLLFDFVCYAQLSYEDDNTVKYNYSKADFGKMRQIINDFDLTNMIQGMSAQDAWNSVVKTLEQAINESVPKIRPRRNDNCSVRKKKNYKLDETVLKKIETKKQAYGKWLKTRDTKDYALYARLRNQVKSECRKSERNHEMKIAKDSKSNPKIFYNFANKKLKVREGIGDLKDNDQTISSSEGKAECLNKFFCSVFTEENLNYIPKYERDDVNDNLENVSFTTEAVRKKLKSLDASKSAGPDGIQTVVLKELADQLAEPLAYLFNQSMCEGKLPDIWKDANVTPLYKKGPKNLPSNYRPVSLTCVLCKIMESVIRDHVVKYLQNNNLLSDFQHGFISQRSCTTNLLATLDSWTQSLDNKSPVDIIYLDFAKAFDSVPHRRLLEKLKAYGITSNLLQWISDFLIGRRQRVHVNGSFSEWSYVVSGVPQGSCLGPVLFVIYINDLPDVVESLTQMYADDTKMFSDSDNLELRQRLQNDLDNLVTWADTWQLRFNADKCHSVHLGFNNQKQEYSMRRHGTDERVVLNQSKVEKDL